MNKEVKEGSLLCGVAYRGCCDVEFYRVVGRTDHTATLMKLEQEYQYYNDKDPQAGGTTTPGWITKGKKFKRKIHEDNTIKIEHGRWASVWDGNPKDWNVY